MPGPISVELPPVASARLGRRGRLYSARTDRRYFHAALRGPRGPLLYVYGEAGCRVGRGWAAIDEPADLARNLAEMLVWTALGPVEDAAAIGVRQCPS